MRKINKNPRELSEFWVQMELILSEIVGVVLWAIAVKLFVTDIKKVF
ncbi:MAG: hypothetical protein KAH07_08390 [Flavobacteriaceae bacterium]|nr:hypothetical protein [Flavobacteriaceae bacterium]